MPSHPQHSVRNNPLMIDRNNMTMLLTEPGTDSDGSCSNSSFSLERVSPRKHQHHQQQEDV